MNQFMPYSGSYIYINYYPYKGNDEWDEPIRDIRVRIQDLGNSDIGEGVNREYLENDNDRLIRKYDARIQILPIKGFEFKVGDAIKVVDTNVRYYVKEVNGGWDSIMMLQNLQFKNMSNRTPKVLYLGDRR